MKRYATTVIMKAGPDPPSSYVIALPKSMCAAEGCLPVVDSAEQTRNVWLKLVRLGPGDPELPPTYRLYVFPYHPPAIERLLRIGIQIQSIYGAGFIGTWFLENMCGLRFLSSAAVDAGSVGSVIEAVHAFDTTDLGNILFRAGPDQLQKYVSYLIAAPPKQLSTGPLTANHLYSWARDSLRRAGIQQIIAPDDFTQAANMWQEFQNVLASLLSGQQGQDQRLLISCQWLRDHPLETIVAYPVDQPLASAPRTPLRRETPERWRDKSLRAYLRIERCFAGEEADALRTPVASWEAPIHPWDDPDWPAMTEYVALDLSVANVPGPHVVSLRSFLPSSTAYCYAVVSCNPRDGTLSLDFKQSTEVHRTVSIRLGQVTDRARELSLFTLALLAGPLDSRSISDQYIKTDAGMIHSFEVSANVAESGLALQTVANCLGSALLEKQRERLGVEAAPHSSVAIADPIDLFKPESRVGLQAATPNDMACSRCTEGQVCACCQSRREIQKHRDLKIAEARTNADVAVSLRRNDRIWSAAVLNVGEACRSNRQQLTDIYRLAAPFSSLLACALAQLAKRGTTDERAAKDFIAATIAERMRLKTDFNADASTYDKYRSEEMRQCEKRFGNLSAPHAEDGSVSFAYEYDPQMETKKGRPNPIGSGAVGEVWRVALGSDKLGNPTKALKLLSDKTVIAEVAGLFETDPLPVVAGFEAYFVQVTLDGATGASPFGILMPYIDGWDLEDFQKVDAHEPTLQQLVGYLVQACDGARQWLENNQGEDLRAWINWDIKPGNLRVNKESGQVFTVDFGLAAILREDGRTHANIGRALKGKELDLFGSMYHVAPEITNGEETNRYTPVYSLAALACNLLGDPNSLQRKNVRPEVPDYLATIFGDSLQEALRRALQIVPDDRGEVKDLEDALKAAYEKAFGVAYAFPA